MRAKAGTGLVTTAPAAIKQYSVMSTYNCCICTDCRATSYNRIPVFVLRVISERGLLTLVKTQDGPQKTPSSNVTPS